MAGDEGDGMVGVAMGDGNAGIGQAADARGDARHDAEGHAGARQRLGFLAAAAEHKGIAALQPQHAVACLCASVTSRSEISSCLQLFTPARLPA